MAHGPRKIKFIQNILTKEISVPIFKTMFNLLSKHLLNAPLTSKNIFFISDY